jgi:hypothetical protein
MTYEECKENISQISGCTCSHDEIELTDGKFVKVSRTKAFRFFLVFPSRLQANCGGLLILGPTQLDTDDGFSIRLLVPQEGSTFDGKE